MDHTNSIKIFFEEINNGEIKNYLAEQKAQGNHWVAYDPDKAVLAKEDLHCFQTSYDAQEFCFENSTDRDFYISDSIGAIERALNKWSALEVNMPDLIQLTDEKMKNADWHYSYSDDYNVYQRGQKEIGEIKHLLLLIRKDAGMEQAQKLWDKYVPENSVSKPDFLINKKQEVMTEKEFQFIEKQFMGLGVKEAFTPALIEQLKKGVAEVQHPFSKQYEGDGEAKAVFHIKKGNEGSLYFLNKWDQEAVRDGENEGLKQTFYNNHHHRNPHSEHYDASKFQTTFTFKSSFNYLMGRPVHNLYKNDNKEERAQWDQLKIKKDGEGKITTEPRHYNEKYPFDLEKTIGNYNILDAAKQEYKDRLIQSYERGNLQLVTFVGKEGNKEKLYTSPNIPLNAMHVYDADKKPVPLETLAEKGYVQKEFAENLKQTVEQFKQKNGNETRQTQAPVQENKSGEKQGVTKEEKEGETAGKHNRQRQTNNQTQRQRKPRHKHQQ